MPYASYEYYKDSYGGQMSEAEFKTLSRKAFAYINTVTFGRAKTYQGGDEVKEACCAVADELKNQENRITSETVGSWTRQYKVDDIANSEKLYQTVSMYLACTGLLYAGGA